MSKMSPKKAAWYNRRAKMPGGVRHYVADNEIRLRASVTEKPTAMSESFLTNGRRAGQTA